MKIAIATTTLFAENSPFNHLLKDILQGFLDAGHSIIRIAAVEHDDDEGYKLGIEDGRITYIPVRRKTAAHGNIISRYLRDNWTAIRMACILRKIDADVLFEDVCYSSFWPVRAAKRKNMHVVAMLQDVWPDNAVQSGLIKANGLLYKYFECWQRYVYRHADKMVCISDDMKDFIVDKGVADDKITVIYNWGYSDETVDIPWDGNEFVKKYDLRRDNFYVIYAGNIGKMQNVELVVKAAALMKDREDIRFLIVGGGAKEDAIQQMINYLDLPNVQMIPMQPSYLATSVYCAAGVNVIPLVPDGVKTAMPSKTGVVLSCGRPVVFAFGKDCSFAKKLEECKAGFYVDAADPHELADEILRIKALAVNKMPSGMDLFKKCFGRSINIMQYRNVFNSLY